MQRHDPPFGKRSLDYNRLNCGRSILGRERGLSTQSGQDECRLCCRENGRL